MLRDFVESQNENLLDDRWRIRVVNQHKLWKVGRTGGVAGVSLTPGPSPASGRGEMGVEDAASRSGTMERSIGILPSALSLRERVARRAG